MSDIKAALEQLDSGNANHWTADGLPRLETVRILAGDPSISREDITQVGPQFTRQNAGAGAPAATPLGNGTASTPPPPPLAPKAPQPPELVATLSAEDNSLETCITELESDLANTRRERAEADEQIAYLVRKLNPLLAERDKAPRMSQGHAMSLYLQSQREIREERAAHIKMIAESGLNLNTLAANLRAPIDSALGRKR